MHMHMPLPLRELMDGSKVVLALQLTRARPKLHLHIVNAAFLFVVVYFHNLALLFVERVILGRSDDLLHSIPELEPGLPATFGGRCSRR